MIDEPEKSQFEEKVIDEQLVYDGHIIQVVNETVTLPNRQVSHRDVVHHAGAVAILVLNAKNEMLVERQWRAPVRKVTTEIPAGKIDARDSTPLDAVVRELNEETRLEAAEINKITGFYTSIGFADEYMHLYVAKKLSPVASALPQDIDEHIEMIWLDFNMATRMFLSGEFEDGKTIMAYLYWQTLQ
ncbi:NUDIX hydrolase [Weissella diestrammenae]|uniref:NUDIX hydrolase n=1 Tax=Weissella diestrammenae TaxID=1162633 RepID=A0A7G9T653_9LACO|nr:NUDIX hydrolase [Weissella diestrammenae]MCM0582418.1 NUDIX hydrolase [Weissella diestrammenae]QNN75578.1 NUDIX hydrolase [Weissella diestrammenae]